MTLSTYGYPADTQQKKTDALASGKQSIVSNSNHILILLKQQPLLVQLD